MAGTTKYHVNKNTGRAGVCRATKKGCPLGEDTPHFNTKEEAKEYIEKSEAESNNQFATVKKQSTKNNGEKIAELQAAIARENKVSEDAYAKYLKMKDNLSPEDNKKIVDAFNAQYRAITEMHNEVNKLSNTNNNSNNTEPTLYKLPKNANFNPNLTIQPYDKSKPITINGYSDDVVEMDNVKFNSSNGEDYNENSWNSDKTMLIGDNNNGNFADITMHYNNAGNWVVQSSMSDEELAKRGINVKRLDNPDYDGYGSSENSDIITLDSNMTKLQELSTNEAEKFYRDNPKHNSSVEDNGNASSTTAPSVSDNSQDVPASIKKDTTSSNPITDSTMPEIERIRREQLLPATNKGDAFHTNINTARSMIRNGPASGQYDAGYFTLNVKTLNPVSKEGEASWLVEDDSAVIILARADGSKVRGVLTQDGTQELSEMGKEVLQTKQQINTRDTTTDGLYVVGSIDSKGNRIGYVPDKKIQTFVFK